MKLVTRGMIWTAASLMILAQAARADEPIKQLMGENFSRAGMILNELIAAQYKDVPDQADLIRQHALRLIEKPPATVTTKEEREMFLTYATFLKNSAANLQEVATTLLKRDQARAQSGELSVDYLRVAAAQHFGNVITACVLCHNQFRRRSL